MGKNDLVCLILIKVCLRLMKINAGFYIKKNILAIITRPRLQEKTKEVSKTRKQKNTCVKFHWINKQIDILFHCSITYHLDSL